MVYYLGDNLLVLEIEMVRKCLGICKELLGYCVYEKSILVSDGKTQIE